MGIRKRSKTFKNIRKRAKTKAKYSKIFKNIQKRSNFLDADCAAKYSHEKAQKTQKISHRFHRFHGFYFTAESAKVAEEF